MSLGDRILRDLAGSTAIFNLGSGMILAVVVLFATQEVGLDAAGFGLIYGLGNVGFVLGRAARRRPHAPLRRRADVRLVVVSRARGDGPHRGRGRAAVAALLLVAGRFVGAAATPIYNVDR